MRRLLIPLVALFAASCSGTDEPADDDCGGQCFTPPSAECDGTNLVRYQVLGICLEGTCEYPTDTEDCADDGQLCSDGACVEPPDLCIGVECVTPPEDSCSDDLRVAITYGEGVCVDGLCEYSEVLDDCGAAQWCVDTSCERQPCAGVECNEAPEATCDGTLLTTFVANGECVAEEGTCEYAIEATADCAGNGQFCNLGACEDIDPCDGVVCDAPPADVCDRNTLIQAQSGVCNSGDCEYPTEDVRCADSNQICRDNECRDRLPCEDVVCDVPPEDFCDGSEILVQHPAVGSCLEDECAYDATFVSCFDTGEVCEGGRCIVPTACTGVVCAAPPEAICADDFIVTRFDEAGECFDGDCIYTEEPYDCRDESGECIDGDCEFLDPCLGVVCNVAPEPLCVGSTSVFFGLPGICDAGDCEFVEDSDDCALSGDICADGVCQDRPDPCEDVTCEPLPPGCDDGDRVSYVGAGTCVGGACDYALVQEREVCTSGCSSGVCVPAGTLLVEGDVIISEVMLAPDADGSFFLEIQDISGNTDLTGLSIIVDGLAPFVVPDGTILEPLGVLVIGDGPGAAPVVDVVWPELIFSPIGAEITLQGAEIVDTLSADIGAGFPATTGRSAQRSGVDITDANWCETWEYQEPIFATAGMVNGSCGRDIVLGELYITEIMPNGVARPGGSPEVWFEMFGTFEENRDLNGLIITSTTHRWVLRDAIIDAEDWAVVGEDASLGSSPNIHWADEFSFGEDDVLTIENGPDVLDVVDFSVGSWAYSTGNAIGFNDGSPYTDNDLPDTWCTTPVAYGRGDNTGTPYDAAVCD